LFENHPSIYLLCFLNEKKINQEKERSGNDHQLNLSLCFYLHKRFSFLNFFIFWQTSFKARQEENERRKKNKNYEKVNQHLYTKQELNQSNPIKYSQL
jgi:hypothetical protein